MKETAFDNLFNYDITNYTIMDLDFFGIKIKPNFFFQKTYKTLLGLFFSLSFIIIVIWEIILKFIDLSGKNYSFNQTSEYLNEKNYILPSFNISICPSKRGLTMDFYYFGYFQISKNYFPYYQDEVNYYQEGSSIINNYTCYKYYLNNSEFYTTDNPFNRTVAKMNIAESYVGEEDEPSDLHLYVIISELFPDNFNFKKRKLSSKTSVYEIQNVDSNNFEMNIFFDSYRIREKNIFFGFEFNKSDKNYTKIVQINIQKVSRSKLEMNSSIKLHYSGIYFTQTFIFYRFEHLFGELGGFTILFYTIFQNLVEIFAQGKVKRGIINQIEKNHEIRQTLGKLRTEDKVDFRSKTLIFTSKNIDDAKKELNETTKKLNAGVNTFSMKNSGSENPQLLKKNKTLLSNINIKIPKKNNYIREINSSIVNSRKIYENEYYQMTKYIDYSYFYQTIKELKIIEMLCLNENNVQYFYNFRNEIFDIYELDQMLERASILNIESVEGNKIFDDYEMKCKIFQKSFFNEIQ